MKRQKRMPALAGNARDHRARFGRLLDRLGRHPPELRLAQARGRLALVADRPRSALQNYATRKSEALAYLGRRLVVAREQTLVRARTETARRSERLGALDTRLGQAVRRLIERRSDRLGNFAALLGTLSYRAVLARGFALVRDEDGAPVRAAASVTPGQRLGIEFADGTRFVRSEPQDDAAPGGKGPPKRKRPPRKPAGAPPQQSLFEV